MLKRTAWNVHPAQLTFSHDSHAYPNAVLYKQQSALPNLKARHPLLQCTSLSNALCCSQATSVHECWGRRAPRIHLGDLPRKAVGHGIPEHPVRLLKPCKAASASSTLPSFLWPRRGYTDTCSHPTAHP